MTEPAPPELIAQLESVCSELHLQVGTDQLATLAAYVELLERWNGVYNLTAVRDRPGILRNHLADCLAIIPSLRELLPESDQTQLLDVGSGGGLPGFIIAALMPQVRVVCVDAVAKKTAFVQQAAGALALPNLSAVHARVERLAGEQNGFGVIVCRAFSSLANFCDLTRKHLAPGGAWLAMKGVRPDAEIAELPEDVEMFHVEQLSVPGLDAKRCAVWMRRLDASSGCGSRTQIDCLVPSSRGGSGFSAMTVPLSAIRSDP